MDLKDKIPPHNDDAERAALGALLLDQEALQDVVQYLRADDFYKVAHRKIFTAIMALFQKGETPDILTVTSELKQSNDLEGSGGAAYIAGLTSQVPSTANLEYYAKIVRERSIRRKLLNVSNNIINIAYDDTQEIRTVVESAEQQIFELTDENQSNNYIKAGDIVSKTIEVIEELYRTKDSYSGIPCGLSDLDYMLNGFQKSEMIIIGARPSVGKTALALTMASNIAIQQKIATGFFTLEMSDMQLMQRLIASEARISSQDIRKGLLRPADFKDLTEAAGNIYEAPLFLADTPNMRLLDLRAQARRMKAQHDVQILFIDYLGLIGAERNDIPRHEQVAEISRSLKALARELDIPIVVLSQVGRQTEGKAPALNDLRESGAIEQDADVVIFIHRERGTEHGKDENPNLIPTELIIAKQRNGPVGTVHTAFLPMHTRFENLDHHN